MSLLENSLKMAVIGRLTSYFRARYNINQQFILIAKYTHRY